MVGSGPADRHSPNDCNIYLVVHAEQKQRWNQNNLRSEEGAEVLSSKRVPLMAYYLWPSQPNQLKSSFSSFSFFSSFSHCQILPSIKQHDHIKSIYWFHQGYPLQFNQTCSYLINLIILDQFGSKQIKLYPTS